VVVRANLARKGESKIDILKLLEELEAIADRLSRRVIKLISGKELDQLFSLINRIRATLPEEVDRASRITGDGERILARAREEAANVTTNAQREAENLSQSAHRDADEILSQARAESERIILQAKEQAAVLVSGDEISRQASEQAQQILTRAEQEGMEMRRQSDEYAKKVFANLEDYTAKVLGHVRTSRERLEEASAVQPTPKQK
jgi:cell division septum initiation protein DivIVA